MLKLTDQLYGTFEIDPVLHELIYSQAIQRLKRVHQGGGTFLVNDRWCGTRYEHSIGVMLLIKLLGGGRRGTNFRVVTRRFAYRFFTCD